MDAMVTARVPVEVKKLGDRKLKEMGSTATELVNAAYEFVIKHDRIPGDVPTQRSTEPVTKTLRGDDAAAFAARWDRFAVLDSPASDDADFRTLLNRARDERFGRVDGCADECVTHLNGTHATHPSDTRATHPNGECAAHDGK